MTIQTEEIVTETIERTVVTLADGCPLCGKTKPLQWKTCKHSKSVAINCNASTADNLGGCGLTSGYKRTKKEVMEYWNGASRDNRTSGNALISEIIDILEG